MIGLFNARHKKFLERHKKKVVYGVSLLLHGAKHFIRRENIITLPLGIPMSFFVLKIFLVFSPQEADNAGNDLEKDVKDDQRSRMHSISMPLFYICAIICLFASKS